MLKNNLHTDYLHIDRQSREHSTFQSTDGCYVYNLVID